MEWFTGWVWRYNFMPSHRGDSETIQQSVDVGDLDGKQAIVLYALGLDNPPLGNLTEADKHFELAWKLDRPSRYELFFANEIASIVKLVDVTVSARDWLTAKKGKLKAGH